MKISTLRLALLLATSILSVALTAQAPNKMSYQTVLRDANNNLVASQSVGIQISILQGSTTGNAVYIEDQTPVTNINGLASLLIGTGNATVGNFSNIDWSNGPYFVKTETDLNGGTNYTITGTQELLSVPYALHAKTADSLSTERSFLFLRKKATVETVPNSTSVTVNNYDIISSNNITLNNNTGEITFTKTGTYTISAHTSFFGNNSGFYYNNPGRKIIWFDCVSNNHPERIASNECDGKANRLSTSLIGFFNAGDRITFKVWQQTGVTVNSPNTTEQFDETQVNIERIR